MVEGKFTLTAIVLMRLLDHFDALFNPTNVSETNATNTKKNISCPQFSDRSIFNNSKKYIIFLFLDHSENCGHEMSFSTISWSTCKTCKFSGHRCCLPLNLGDNAKPLAYQPVQASNGAPRSSSSVKHKRRNVHVSSSTG